MKVLIDDTAYTVEDIEIALRYAAADAADDDVKAALLIAAAALAGVGKETAGAEGL